MENLFYNISQVLGITVIHSLWQGLILFILLRIFLLVFPGTTAVVKYRVAYGTLTAILLWFMYTLFMQLTHYEWQSTTALPLSPLALPAAMQSLSEPANHYYFLIAGYMPYITIAYVVGLVFNTLRLSLAWNSIYRIRQNITQADFAAPIRRLSKQLNLGKHVEAAFSEWVDVPCITGFVKPIILLPFSLSCYLNADEIEAILLHELTHIKRNDYLFNFIQQVISILLFFNPFARLVGKLISEERENCCDDAVVQITGSPFIYAQALLKLEENKQNLWQLALASTGKTKYELLNRIERIMKTKKPTINIRPIIITVLALTFSITSIAWLDPKIENGKFEVKKLTPAIEMLNAFTSNGDIAAAETTTNTTKIAKPKRHKVIIACGDTSFSNLADTIKSKKGKYKIIIEDENGDRKEYNSAQDLPVTVKEDLNINNSYHFAFTDSNRYAKFREFYNSAKWKDQQKYIEKQAYAMTKKFNSPEWKAHQKEIEKNAAKIAKQFDSPEWKAKQKEMIKNAEKMAKHFDSPEWKKRQEDIAKNAEAIAKQFDGPEWKNQQADIEKNAEAIGKQFDTPEWRKHAEEMGKEAGKMAKSFVNSPEFKRYQKELIKNSKDMAKKFNSPEWKKSMKGMKFNFDYSEKPDAPEKPEAQEKPEVVKPVAPVAPQKPE